MFETKPHWATMYSLAPKYFIEEINDFFDSIQQYNEDENDFIVQPKIDGLSIELIYHYNQLQHALLRGDGKFGEDVLYNVINIESIPKVIDNEITKKSILIVRGEIYIDKICFPIVNKDLLNEGKNQFTTARHAAAGTLRNNDHSLSKKYELKFYPFELANALQYNIDTDIKALEFLKILNFPISNSHLELKNKHTIGKVYADYVNKHRDQLPYEIDGIVIKVNNLKLRSIIKGTARYPKWAIAWKFPPKIAISKINDITYSIGNKGKITPIAIIDPVIINGINISKISLYSKKYMELKKIKINNVIEIGLIGEAIPQILRSFDSIDQLTNKDIKRF